MVYGVCEQCGREQDAIDDLADAEWLHNALDAFHLEDDRLCL